MQNTFYKYFGRLPLSLMLALIGTQLHAKEVVATKNLVSISDAWVRPTNPGQEVGAAYMTFLSKQDMTLVSIESSATDSVEIHNMTMENGVMKMRMMENLALKAGEPYKLAPGGFHLMLFDLKKPLAVGEQVRFTLHFKSTAKSNAKSNVTIKNHKNKSSDLTQTINVMVQAPPENTAH
ncbi:MAG: copper chaperone PCu(A)C [Methylotenera sp.]|uniref:copper chaperone PCu(A)C n=1 Tax=Methylotenera sp. TaxID=2051956 RepID=UPI002488D101|nr:copper chaperone PCu(A)C [Methylotenera sp.]MDI1310236.1 copper chaperone PCu(A)C [Methylotenera sp.]